MCEEPVSSPFSISCAIEIVTVFQSEDRRKTDNMLAREVAISSNGFSLSADMVSHPANLDKFDKNQFGFYFTLASGNTFALRVEGQSFNFEEWLITDTIKIIDSFNRTYAPALNSAGRVNNINLVCDSGSCDLFGNDILIGRSPFGIQANIIALGFFTASNWDQEFGNILLESLSVTQLSASRPEKQAFILDDNLIEDSGVFSQMGLSGAFSEFDEDGFHFSPVIPYGYYAAKSGPSLADMSVVHW